jgi:hypothetical protein
MQPLRQDGLAARPVGRAREKGATPVLVARGPVRGSLGRVSGKAANTSPRRHDVPESTMAERAL